MPKVEPTKASSPPATSPPRRVSGPITPAANARGNPIDAKSSPKGSPTVDRSGKQPKASDDAEPAVIRRATSEAPVAKPQAGTAATATATPAAAGVVAAQGAAAAAAGATTAAPSGKSPVDMETFDQLLELDDDPEEHEFSRGVVQGYFSQFRTTYKDIGASLKSEDVAKLASLGHFLKGSSAALGVWKVQETCEGIQHAGQLRGDDEATLTKGEAIKKIQALYDRVEDEFLEAKDWFEGFFPGGVGTAPEDAE